MIKFEVNGKRGSYIFPLPTELKELTPEYLNYVTEEVEIANDYTLIGICYREKLSTIIMSARQNKNLTTAVVPIFIKRGNTTGEANCNPNTGDKLIISGSQLSLGHHVVCPKNTLTINNFISFTDGDGLAYQNAVKENKYVYFLEFKIIPNCDIVGIYKDVDKNCDFKNPFKEYPTIAGDVN